MYIYVYIYVCVCIYIYIMHTQHQWLAEPYVYDRQHILVCVWSCGLSLSLSHTHTHTKQAASRSLAAKIRAPSTRLYAPPLPPPLVECRVSLLKGRDARNPSSRRKKSWSRTCGALSQVVGGVGRIVSFWASHLRRRIHACILLLMLHGRIISFWASHLLLVIKLVTNLRSAFSSVSFWASHLLKSLWTSAEGNADVCVFVCTLVCVCVCCVCVHFVQRWWAMCVYV
jgi:hypothetical protein